MSVRLTERSAFLHLGLGLGIGRGEEGWNRERGGNGERWIGGGVKKRSSFPAAQCTEASHTAASLEPFSIDCLTKLFVAARRKGSFSAWVPFRLFQLSTSVNFPAGTFGPKPFFMFTGQRCSEENCLTPSERAEVLGVLCPPHFGDCSGGA